MKPVVPTAPTVPAKPTKPAGTTKVVAKSGTLPKTGDNSNHEVGVVGAGLLSAALLAALGVSKRKEEEL
ncbi:LPXTG cell wall anchor domain-containing protein [Streptococcus sp. 27098_8_113]|uniref:LPXTG cell wall anchor domain-containing protein n=1 Tax=Streptococcus cristatus TaxID=45634 RepID=UPI00163AAB6B